LDAELAKLNAVLDAQPYLSGREFGLADIAYVPWLLRARDRMGVQLGHFGALGDWLARLSERPAIAAELDVVAAL
jgi:glutathione S-transferase